MHHVPVTRIDRGPEDPHQDLIASWDRRIDFLELEDTGWAVLVADDRLHTSPMRLQA